MADTVPKWIAGYMLDGVALNFPGFQFWVVEDIDKADADWLVCYNCQEPMMKRRLWYRVEPEWCPSFLVIEMPRLHKAWERSHVEFLMNACCYCVDTSIGGHMEACFLLDLSCSGEWSMSGGKVSLLELGYGMDLTGDLYDQKVWGWGGAQLYFPIESGQVRW